MSITKGYDWKQDRTGKWRLWEFEPRQPIDNWYREAVNGVGRLVKDPDGLPLPRFDTPEIGEAFLERYRWGRVILGRE